MQLNPNPNGVFTMERVQPVGNMNVVRKLHGMLPIIPIKFFFFSRNFGVGMALLERSGGHQRYYDHPPGPWIFTALASRIPSRQVLVKRKIWPPGGT